MTSGIHPQRKVSQAVDIGLAPISTPSLLTEILNGQEVYFINHKHPIYEEGELFSLVEKSRFDFRDPLPSSTLHSKCVALKNIGRKTTFISIHPA